MDKPHFPARAYLPMQFIDCTGDSSDSECKNVEHDKEGGKEENEEEPGEEEGEEEDEQEEQEDQGGEEEKQNIAHPLHFFFNSSHSDHQSQASTRANALDEARKACNHKADVKRMRLAGMRNWRKMQANQMKHQGYTQRRCNRNL